MSDIPTLEWASKYADFLETILPVMEATEVQVAGQPVDNMAGVTAARLNIAALRTFAEHGRSAAKYRNQVIQELIEKALGSEADNYKAYDGYVAEWLRSQMEGE